MNNFLLSLSFIIIFSISLYAQSNDTIPPSITFDNSEARDSYSTWGSFGQRIPPEIIDTDEDTTIVKVSCVIAFPYDFFPEAHVEDDKDLSPKVTFENIINDNDELVNDQIISVTRIWTATDASGNTAKHYYIIQYDRNTFHTPIPDAIMINNTELKYNFGSPPPPHTVCLNEEVTLGAIITRGCNNQSTSVEWYLNSDNEVDKENLDFGFSTYKWEKEGDYKIRVRARGDGVYGGAEERTYFIRVRPPLTVVPKNLISGQLNTAYTPVKFSASGGTEPYSLTLQRNPFLPEFSPLPPGMSFDGATATLSGTPTQAGTFEFTIIASETSTESTTCPTRTTYTLIIDKLNQTINFNTLPNKTYGDAPFELSATASSNLPIIFSVVSGPAVINKNTITITGAGTVIIRASQEGNNTYAASHKDQTFTVAKANQTINSFNVPTEKTFGEPPFTINATASSNLDVSFSIISGPAEINEKTITLKGPGQVVVRATQVGNNNYNPAPNVDKSFKVNSPPVSIALGQLNGTSFCEDASITISFTISGAFSADNTFTAQLSNPDGLFPATPTPIGSLKSNSGGSITAKVPSNITAGNNYRIRIVSSSPVFVSTDNGTNLIIKTKPIKPKITLNNGLLTSSSTIGNQWFYNGSIINGATGETYIASTPGNYTVQVTNECGSGPISDVFALNVTGISFSEINDLIKIYPNPVDKYLTIELPSDLPYQSIRLINLQGKQLNTFSGTSKTNIAIDVSFISAGIYILEIQLNQGFIYKKILIQ